MEPWSPASVLPAAWLVALGLLLLLASRRWLDPIPWRVAGVWALFVGVLLWPALGGGKVLLPLGHLVHFTPYRTEVRPDPPTHDLQGDLVVEIQPWQVQVRRALAAGRWPLWNELAGAGMGLLADPQSQALQPLALATLGVGDPAAPGLLAALRILAAMSGMFLLLRRQGLGEPAALLGSLAHGLGAPLLMWLGWPLASALALLPWALYAAVRCDQAGGRRDWVLLVLALFALLLAGHPELVLYATGVAGCFLAAAVWRRRGSGTAGAFLARAVAAALVAAALAAPALLPARTLLEQSDRAAVVGAHLTPRPWGETARAAWLGLTRPDALARWRERLGLRAAALLTARSRGDFDAYWGEGNFVSGGANFNPGPILLLGAIGLVPARRRLGGERPMQALLAASLLLAAQPDGLRPLGGRLSLLGAGFLDQHPRLLLIAAFALAYLAACEAERWVRGERRAAFVGLGAIAPAAAILWAYLAYPRYGSGAPLYWLERRSLVVELAALAAAALVLALAARRAPALHRAAAVTACAAVVAVELLFFMRAAVRPGPERLYYRRLAPVAFLNRNLGAARFAGVEAALKPNLGQVRRLNDLRIHGPSRPAAYDRFLRPLWTAPPRAMGTYFMVTRFGHPLHDLLGVRFVLAPAGTRLPLPLALRRETGWVYERPGWLPRLFLPRGVVGVPRRELDSAAARTRDFAARSVLAVRRGAPRIEWRARGEGVALDRLALPEPERVTARARLVEPRLLASSVFQDGGWHLLSQGRPRATRLANGPFVAGWLPPGEQRVEMLYRPPGFLAGCVLAALALGALTAVGLPPPSPATGRQSAGTRALD